MDYFYWIHHKLIDKKKEEKRKQEEQDRVIQNERKIDVQEDEADEATFMERIKRHWSK